MSSWRALATSSSLSDLPLSGTPRYRRKDPRCVTCTPTASRAVVARHFRVEMDASQPCRRLWASRGAVIAVRSPATKMSIASNFCASLAGGYYLRVARQGSPGAVYISPTFTIAPTAAPNSNIVATTEAAATPAVIITAATATDTVTAAALVRTEPTRQTPPRYVFACRHCPCSTYSNYCSSCSGYCPGCSGYCSSCSGYCPGCPGYFPGCSYAVQHYRVTFIEHRLLVPRRVRYSVPAEVHHIFGLWSIIALRLQPPHRRYRVANEEHRED